jgi:hypothetical protein
VDVPARRASSPAPQAEAIPAWVFLLLVILPLVAGWLVARSVHPDLSWARASFVARSDGSRAQIPSASAANIPAGQSVVSPAPDSQAGAVDTEPLTAVDTTLTAVDLPGPRQDETAQVAHTDGLGVVLRTAPRADARVPRGLLDGARVTILERPDGEWAHVRAENGLEGWMPVQYLAIVE